MDLDEYYDRMIARAQRALDGQQPLAQTVSGRITGADRVADRPVSRRGRREGAAKSDRR